MQLCLPGEWIAEGATVEIELPRNLACAACDGGGCDSCERSGAVSLRGKQDPIELVEVTLPARDAGTPPESTRVIVRIPFRGGLPPRGSELPRGNLLLSVRVGPLPQRGVARLAAPSLPPPSPEAAPVVSIVPAVPARRRVLVALAVAAVLLIVCLVILASR